MACAVPYRKLDGPLHFTAAETAGAYIHPVYFTFYQGFDSLNVGFPFAFGFQVRVADVHAGLFAFAAHIA
jgi:hypothetical protein